VLAKPLERVRRQIARSNLAARCAVLLRNQLDGIVYLHLGHDIDHTVNGEQWLLDQVAPSADSFVDVGANAGDWSDMFLARCRKGARGVLFDPSRAAHAHLERRFSGHPGVRVVRAAVSDTVGTVPFHEEANLGPTSSLVVGFSRPDATRTLVDTTTV